MKSRVLFHLRLGGSSSSSSNPQAALTGLDPQALGVNCTSRTATPTTRTPSLRCTCLHSSSPSSVAIGFERGVVQVFHRKEQGVERESKRQDCEEEGWIRSVLYPITALGGAGPNGTLLAVPDITCIAVSLSGEMLAVGTSDGFVFVTQVGVMLEVLVEVGLEGLVQAFS